MHKNDNLHNANVVAGIGKVT